MFEKAKEKYNQLMLENQAELVRQRIDTWKAMGTINLDKIEIQIKYAVDNQITEIEITGRTLDNKETFSQVPLSTNPQTNRYSYDNQHQLVRLISNELRISGYDLSHFYIYTEQ